MCSRSSSARRNSLLPKVEELLNKKSGLLGLSGVSSDMREILRAADQGHQRALIALKAYCYRVRKYIGAYVASMGGLDTVIFTAGVGQGSAVVRALALQGLECMGIKPDNKRNREASGDEISRISTDDSKVSCTRRADRRGTHDGTGSVACVKPLLHHARP